MKYGKTAQIAIAAMSLLAEVYDGGKTCLSSLDIAKKRELPRPIVAKLLTVLSQSGYVKGSPGPRGGYWLAKAPGKISFHEIVCLFEKTDETTIMCPFGPNWCGNGNPCPVHDQLVELHDQKVAFLKETSLAAFCKKTAKAST